jgi:hypothetical protein
MLVSSSETLRRDAIGDGVAGAGRSERRVGISESNLDIDVQAVLPGWATAPSRWKGTGVERQFKAGWNQRELETARKRS